jgi:hypothetical protein
MFAKHRAWPAFAVTAGGHFCQWLRATRRVRRQSPVAWLRGSRQPPVRACWGLPWGLALMRRYRRRGIVGYTAESSASPRHRGPDGSRSKGESNDQVTHPAERTQPTPPDAAGLPAAALAVTLAACGSSAGQSRHPAASKPAGAAHSHAHSRPAHAAPLHRRHHAARAAGHCRSPYRQPHPAGQRRRP